MNLLRQSTATTLLLGPFVDSVDATPETGLTLSQADILLWKEGGTTLAQKNDATSCTHRSNSMYTCPVNATDTNTLGALEVSVFEAGTMPYTKKYTVVPAMVYDSFVLGTDTLDIQVTGMGAGTITASAIATGAIDADALAADAGTEIGTAVWATAARTLTALDEDTTTLDLDATIRAAVGLASANLDTQLAAISKLVLRTGTAQAGSINTITLDAGASSTTNVYNRDTISISSGTGAGQSNQVASYDGGSKIATMLEDWIVAPNNTSVFVITPFGVTAATVVSIVAAVWAAQRASNGVAGSFGERVNADMTHISGNSTAADNAETVFLTAPGAMAVDVQYINGNAAAADNLHTAYTGGAFSPTGWVLPWNPAWDAEVQEACGDALGSVDTELATILSRLPAALSGGYMSCSLDAGLGVSWQLNGVGDKNIGPPT